MVTHIVCVLCVCVCVGRVMLEHSKAALVIAVSALERRARVSEGGGGHLPGRQRPPCHPPTPVPLDSLSACAGLAVIANVNKTWPQCVCVCVCLNVISNICTTRGA